MRQVGGRLRWGFDEYFEAFRGVVMITYGIAWMLARALVVVAAGRIMGLW